MAERVSFGRQCTGNEGKRRLVRIFGAALLTLALPNLVISTAEARRFRHHHSGGGAGGYEPPYADMVIDGNTGRVLHSVNADELRHPASITKVMTLYLLFEQIEKGRFRMDTPLQISAHAAAQAPSKLGLRPGETITVQDAIKSIVTHSCNDIAVAVAENIAGDEDSFAEMMTKKAHALGMSRTHYANASGLPNNEQITTARDLTILGRALQDHFPQYYHFFSTHSFAYDGRILRNHNHMLDRVEGMDGIKTGYTTASGFNLLTSVHRDGHFLIAAVLGGRSAASRDKIMDGLIEANIDNTATSRTAPMVADSENDDDAPRPSVRAAVPVKVAAADDADATDDAVPAPLPMVKAVPAVRPRAAVISGTPRVTQVADKNETTASIPERKHLVADGATPVRTVTASAAGSTTTNMRWVQGPAGKQVSAKAADDKAPVKVAAAAPPAKPEPRPVARTGWLIQVGATDDVEKAQALLTRAKSSSRGALASAQAYTEKVQKGRETLYRARFAVLDSDAAESACKVLKRSGMACMSTKN